jgi:hypothetical protein
VRELNVSADIPSKTLIVHEGPRKSASLSRSLHHEPIFMI